MAASDSAAVISRDRRLMAFVIAIYSGLCCSSSYAFAGRDCNSSGFIPTVMDLKFSAYWFWRGSPRKLPKPSILLIELK